MSEHPRGAGPGRVTTVPAVTTRTFRRGLFAAALLGLAVRAAYILIVRHDVLPGDGVRRRREVAELEAADLNRADHDRVTSREDLQRDRDVG